MSRTQRIGSDVVASLLAHKPRAFLMMLGVAVGVAVLSAVIAIGQGTRARLLLLVETHNLDMIMVRAGGDAQVFAPTADRGSPSLRGGCAWDVSRPQCRIGGWRNSVR